MYIYEVGKIITAYIGVQDSVKFDILDDGAILAVAFRNLTEKEILQYQSQKIR